MRRTGAGSGGPSPVLHTMQKLLSVYILDKPPIESIEGSVMPVSRPFD